MSQNRKLIYVLTEDWYFWLHRLALARAAQATGAEIIVATRVAAHGDRIRAAGFTLVPLPWQRRSGSLRNELRTLILLWRLFRREKPDLVHSFGLKPIIYGGIMARMALVRRRIATVAGLGFVFASPRAKARLMRPFVVLALRLAMGGAGSRVMLENPDDGRQLVRYGALTKPRIKLVACCGVDTDHFVPAPFPEGPIIAGMATRLVRDKGAGLAIEAMRLLRREGTDITFRLAGGIDPFSPDSHTKEEVEGWVRDGLVRWEGHVDDVAAFWQACHVALYPSRYGEGVPKTLLEAAACGRPVITTDMPGCREAVADGVNGFLVPPGDPALLAARLRQLAEDPALRQRMGEAGRARALTEFADPVVTAKMIAVYGLAD